MVRRMMRVLAVITLVTFASFKWNSVNGEEEKEIEMHKVVVGPGLYFDPRELEINVGSMVIFVWVKGSASSLPHTVTESLGSSEKQICLRKKNGFHSGLLLSGAKWNHTFTEVGEVPYHCETTTQNCEAGMHGIITVVESGAVSKKPSKVHGEEVDAKTVGAATAKATNTVGLGKALGVGA